MVSVETSFSKRVVGEEAVHVEMGAGDHILKVCGSRQGTLS